MVSEFEWETDRVRIRRAKKARRRLRTKAWKKLNRTRLYPNSDARKYPRIVATPGDHLMLAALSTLPAPLSKPAKAEIQSRYEPILRPDRTYKKLKQSIATGRRKWEHALTPLGHLLDALSFVGLLTGLGALFAASSRPLDDEISLSLKLGAVSAAWLLFRTRNQWRLKFEIKPIMLAKSRPKPKQSSLQARLAQLEQHPGSI